MVDNLLKQNTEILYKGTENREGALHPETPAIYPSSAYIIEDTRDYDFANSGGKYFYNRTANPNRDGLAEAISYLENGEDTLVCSSGMGAISTTLLGLLKCGDHAVFNKSIYGETIELIEILEGFGVHVSLVDFTNIEEFESAMKDGTKVVYTEIIANPLTLVVDIEKISKISHSFGAMVVVDSTFTTPFVMKPLDFGADIVIHSLTKFFGGHSDVTGGSITASNEIIKKMKQSYLLLGASLDANSAWLLQRSIKTMGLRMRAQLDNAVLVAEALSKNPHIQCVYHPSLENHPQHALASQIFSYGYGAMISFSVEDNREKVDEFIRRLKVIKYLGTLGGIRTTLAHPATAFRNEFTEEELRKMGIHEGLIRISTGAEDVGDLIEDLNQALEVFNKA